MRLIDADALLRWVQNSKQDNPCNDKQGKAIWGFAHDHLLRMISDAPVVQTGADILAVQKPAETHCFPEVAAMTDTARWIPFPDGWFDLVMCSKCHIQMLDKDKKEECPGCKRKMKEC